MSKAREHLTKLYSHLHKRDMRDAEHHLAEAKHHASLIKHHRQLSELHAAAGEEELSDTHHSMAEGHNAEHTRHLGLGETCASDAKEMAECSKAAMGGDLEKADQLVPDNVRGTIPSNVPDYARNVAVPRPGQPNELVNKRDVPPEFEEFLKIEEW